MAIDTSIYGMIQPQRQVQGPLEQYGSALQIRHLIDSGELSALQRQQLQRTMAEDEATSAAYRQSGGDPVKLRDLLYGQGLVKPAMAAEKNALEVRAKNAQIAKDEGKDPMSQANLFAKNMTIGRDILATVNDDAALSGLRDWTLKTFGMKAAQGIPQTVNDPNFAAWREKNLMTADKMIISAEARLADERARSEGALGRGVTVRGQDMTDTRAREEGAANRGVSIRGQNISADTTRRGQDMTDFRAGEKAAQEKLPNESQGKASLFGTRAMEADKILREVGADKQAREDRISTIGLANKQAVSGIPVVGGALGGAANMILSKDQQKVEQAQRDFVNAILRVESGAVISEQEFENAKKQYFPQPGDGKDVIQQKRRNRTTAIEGLKVMAGPAGGRITPPSAASASSGRIKFLGME